MIPALDVTSAMPGEETPCPSAIVAHVAYSVSFLARVAS